MLWLRHVLLTCSSPQQLVPYALCLPSAFSFCSSSSPVCFLYDRVLLWKHCGVDCICWTDCWQDTPAGKRWIPCSLSVVSWHLVLCRLRVLSPIHAPFPGWLKLHSVGRCCGPCGHSCGEQVCLLCSYILYFAEFHVSSPTLAPLPTFPPTHAPWFGVLRLKLCGVGRCCGAVWMQMPQLAEAAKVVTRNRQPEVNTMEFTAFLCLCSEGRVNERDCQMKRWSGPKLTVNCRK